MAANNLTIKLTEDQQSQIKNATGKSVNELDIDLASTGEKISSPDGPTTVAVWEPWTKGRGVTRSGRKGKPYGMQVKVLL